MSAARLSASLGHQDPGSYTCAGITFPSTCSTTAHDSSSASSRTIKKRVTAHRVYQQSLVRVYFVTLRVVDRRVVSIVSCK